MAEGKSVREIAELALRKIGDFAPNDSGADPQSLEIACSYLDLVVQHLTGTLPAVWLVPAELQFNSIANQPSYLLSDVLGANYPADGVFFPYHATVTFQGRESDLPIILRQEYDDIADKAAPGKPEQIFIDRLISPTAYLHPVPTTTNYRINIRAQVYNRKLSIAGVLPSLAEKPTGFRSVWDLYLVDATAYEIGGGPVRSLPENELRRLERERDKKQLELEGFTNQEHADENRQVKFHEAGL